MKRIMLVCLTALAVSGTYPLYAQSSGSDFMAGDKSLFEEVTGIKKKTDKFNLYLNMHGDFNMKWNDSGFDQGAFEMKQLRIEMKGDINDWLSYRYRQRLNRGNDGSGNIDNVPTSIDWAGVGIKLNKFSFFAGKQCVSYGGIEFDLNPIDIYEYSDMIEHMSIFMTGLNVAYNYNPYQQIQFQVLNSRNGPSEEMYGDLERTKLPLVYTLNWNGNFLDVFKTRWSASVMNETKGEKMYYYALGNEFNFSPKWHAYFDWMYSREGVDRKGIITNIVGTDNQAHNAFNAEYMSYVLHVNYRFAPKWNLFAKGMYETASVYKASDEVEKGKYRTAWGYAGGIEFYPMESNLHFFLAYVGRSYKYTDRAKALGEDNFSTHRVSVGFIWQMPVF